jgi:peptidoglycan biosynthesis protein MviN/MurJ (putative lipid II flippase)
MSTRPSNSLLNGAKKRDVLAQLPASQSHSGGRRALADAAGASQSRQIVLRKLGFAHRRLAAVHPDHKRIAVGAIWVGGFVVAGKFAAAARDMAIAWRYGLGETVDAYQLASTLVFWLPVTLVSTLTVVLVPMLVRLRKSGAENRGLFLQEIQGSVLLVGAVLAGLSLFLAAFSLPSLADKLSAASRQMAWQFTLSLAPLAILSAAIGVSSARLMAQERQVNTLLEGIPAAVILLSVLFWPRGTSVQPLVWGTGVGMFVHCLWSWRLAGRNDGQPTTPRFSRTSPHWSEFYGAVGVMGAGHIVMSFVTPLDQYHAGQHGDAAIATLGYANRLIGLLLGGGAIAFSRSALPVMSEIYASGHASRAEHMSLQWARLMLSVGLAISAVAWAGAPMAITLFFQHGAFTTEDTYRVAQVFRWGLLQVPFYFAGLVLVQLLASRGRFAVIAAFACSNFVVKLLLNIALSPRMGIVGISLATSLMYAWSAACLWMFVMRTRVGPETEEVTAHERPT